MASTKKLISEALHLKPAEKFIVIEALIQSLDIPDPKIQEAWAKEAEKRLAAYKAGELETVSFTDMFGKESD
ncbi:MAG: addiction module protein [Actinobacteria bacterium]|nr:addiction module protein [Actinomycetota bacterium]